MNWKLQYELFNFVHLQDRNWCWMKWECLKHWEENQRNTGVGRLILYIKRGNWRKHPTLRVILCDIVIESFSVSLRTHILLQEGKKNYFFCYGAIPSKLEWLWAACIAFISWKWLVSSDKVALKSILSSLLRPYHGLQMWSLRKWNFKKWRVYFRPYIWPVRVSRQQHAHFSTIWLGAGMRSSLPVSL